MDKLKLFDAEFKFMDIVWEHEPVNSTELTRMCEKKLGWKRPTTYSMIKKLNERGLMQNLNATVTTLIQRNQVQKYEADMLLDKAFGGSVPFFIATFLEGKTLSEKEAAALKKLIEDVTK